MSLTSKGKIERLFINIPITPVPKGRPRFDRRGIARTPAATRNYEHQLKIILRKHYKGLLINSAVQVRIECHLPRPKKPSNSYPRGDVDNYAKAILDAANGIIWKDDAQIYLLVVCKFYTVEMCGFTLFEVFY